MSKENDFINKSAHGRKCTDADKCIYPMSPPDIIIGVMKRPILTALLICISLSLAAAETGIASWYTSDRPDALTANGEIFDNTKLTAAHKSLTFGSMVRVTNDENGQSIEVRINDRGPYVENRIIDLTPEGARQLGFYDQGIAPVTLEVISTPDVPESEYVDGSQTGWYTLQVGSYTNIANAYTVYDNIRKAGLKPTVEIVNDTMVRISVANVQAYLLQDTLEILSSIGIGEPLVKGARSPY